MEISVIGSGYVGTTIAACFADLGHTVVNIDIDPEIVDSINRGEPPLYEDGLSELIGKHAGDKGTGRLHATMDYDAILDTEITFLCLPTPQNTDGSIDLSILEASATQLGETLHENPEWHTVVVKSTVIPGTTEETITPIIAEASQKVEGESLGIGMNPEFLREGTAVQDFQQPEKVVLGADSDRTREDMKAVFAPLIDKVRSHVVETNTRTAEMIKYANNGFLATKVSLINDIGNICKEFGVDAYEVAEAIGLDNRIGERFLRSGLGWGGSCFPKDTNAIIHAAEEQDYDPSVLQAAVEVNDNQPERLLSLLDDHIDVSGQNVAVLGLAFKPGTDDIRNSRAIPVIEGLHKRGATITAYDPVAASNMQERYPDLDYANSPADALDGAVACVICTDWDEFEALNEEFTTMEHQIVTDGRRVIEPQKEMVYEGITW